jgi:predicted RNA-binding protein YlxR (DUF448 family)
MFLLKHYVKLRRCVLCGDVAACREMVRVLFVVHNKQHTRHAATSPQNIYNDVILLNVFTEV